MDVDSDTEVEALSTSSQPTSRLSNIDRSMWKTIALGAIVIILFFSNTIWDFLIQPHNPIVESDVIPNDPFKSEFLFPECVPSLTSRTHMHPTRRNLHPSKSASIPVLLYRRVIQQQ